MRTLIGALTVLALLGATAASAHGVGAESEGRHLHWIWESWVLIGLGLAAAWYAAGVAHLRRRLGPERVIGRGQIAAFAAGLGTLFLALESPIDTVAEQLFWVHMVQHLMLMLFAAPLLVWGRPVVAFIWALPPAGRKRLGRGWMASGFATCFRWLMHPAAVWVLFSGTFVFWHLPGPYEWALRHEIVHVVEHVSFLLSALAFWTLVLEPLGSRRLGYGGRLMLVATMAVISGMPGALMILAPRPLYAVHTAGVAAWGMSLMEDQQLAGLVMWIPGGMVYLAACGWLFVRWLRDAELRADAQLRRASSWLAVLALAVALPLGLSGCYERETQPPRFGGDPEHGARLIADYGCGSCHIVPGVSGAEGLVGPPLTKMGRRIYVAGILRNNPGNLISWLRDPQKFVPGNAMPNLGLSEAEARDIAAYLYTLR